MFNFNTVFGPSDAPSRQIPPKLLVNEFGEVSIRRVQDRLQVAVSLAMGAYLLGDGESCTVGLALDASQSMKDDYGRGRTLPADVSKRFIEAGMFEEQTRDGVTRRVLSKQGKAEVERQGLVKATVNIVHEPACQMIENLLRTFATGGAANGACEVIYWACGAGGKDLESLGALGAAMMPQLRIQGPQRLAFGPETHLAPPFLYFAEKARQTNGVFVFVTDGHIDDEAEVVRATHRLAGEMKTLGRPSLKCVLIGVGNQVDVAQFNRIDDMDMPDDIAGFDIWNSKVLREMRDMNDAWSEIFDPQTEVATTVVIRDDRGETVYQKTDGVQALIVFEMPAGSKYFELTLDGDLTVRQELPA